MEIIISTTINLILWGTYDVWHHTATGRRAAPGRGGRGAVRRSRRTRCCLSANELHIDTQIIKYIKYIFILYLKKYISHCRHLETKRLETLNLNPLPRFDCYLDLILQVIDVDFVLVYRRSYQN